LQDEEEEAKPDCYLQDEDADEVEEQAQESRSAWEDEEKLLREITEGMQEEEFAEVKVEDTSGEPIEETEKLLQDAEDLLEADRVSECSDEELATSPWRQRKFLGTQHPSKKQKMDTSGSMDANESVDDDNTRNDVDADTKKHKIEDLGRVDQKKQKTKAVNKHKVANKVIKKHADRYEVDGRPYKVETIGAWATNLKKPKAHTHRGRHTNMPSIEEDIQMTQTGEAYIKDGKIISNYPLSTTETNMFESGIVVALARLTITR